MLIALHSRVFFLEGGKCPCRNSPRADGTADADIHGVMGGAWLAPDIDTLWEDSDSRETLMKTVRMLDGHTEIIGLSGHLLAIVKRK